MLVAAACCVLLLPLTGSAADDRDALARARRLYNDGRFADAIDAADQARTVPTAADSADLIAARAYLERFRDSAAQADITAARDRLRRIDARKFSGPERDEYLVGLGETLFFDADYGAAAEVFASIVANVAAAPDARDRVLDWWATSLDRDARPRPEMDRQSVYQRIRDRMQLEQASRPASAIAAYWVSAAAQGQGDWLAAWSAAEAAWVRAPLTSAGGVALRADVDHLVLRALVPARARALAQPQEMVRADWERFKERWTP